MTEREKEILLGKADTLRWSFADAQMQALMGVVTDLIRVIPVEDKPTMGFTTQPGETEK